LASFSWVPAFLLVLVSIGAITSGLRSMAPTGGRPWHRSQPCRGRDDAGGGGGGGNDYSCYCYEMESVVSSFGMYDYAEIR